MMQHTRMQEFSWCIHAEGFLSCFERQRVRTPLRHAVRRVHGKREQQTRCMQRLQAINTASFADAQDYTYAYKESRLL